MYILCFKIYVGFKSPTYSLSSFLSEYHQTKAFYARCYMDISSPFFRRVVAAVVRVLLGVAAVRDGVRRCVWNVTEREQCQGSQTIPRRIARYLKARVSAVAVRVVESSYSTHCFLFIMFWVISVIIKYSQLIVM